MPFQRLPLPSEEGATVQTRCLIKLCMELERTRFSLEPPWVRFLASLKEAFAAGCNLTTLSDDDPAGFSEWARASLLQANAVDPAMGLHAFNQNTHMIYLMLPVHPPRNLQEAVSGLWLLLWRRGSMFNENDVGMVRVALFLLRSRVSKSIPLESGDSSNASVPRHHPHSLWRLTEEGRPLNDPLVMALNALSDPVFLCCPIGSILRVNEEGLRSFGASLYHTLQRNQLGIDWLSRLLHPDDVEETVGVWQTALQAPQVKLFTCRLMVDGGSYRKFLCRLVPCYTVCEPSESVLAGWVIHAVDLDRSPATEEVRRGADLKNRFLAEMSHEIRTPLACVIGTCSLIRYTPLTAEQEELLNTIGICSKQLLTLINNILDLSKLEQHRLTVEVRPLLLERCLEELLEIFSAELKRKDMIVRLEISDQVPLWLQTDELRLRQVLTNLMSNAVKFSRDTGGVIRVGVEVMAGRLLHFWVADQGIGIPSDVNPSRLFDSFCQLDGSIARRYGGTGLGLVISKKLVQLMGGDIWYESEPGKGTTMHFTTRLMDTLSAEQMQEIAKDDTYYSYQQGKAALRAYWRNLRQGNHLIRVKLDFDRTVLADHVRCLLSPLFETDSDVYETTLLISDDRARLEQALPTVQAAILLTYDKICEPKGFQVIRRVIKPSQLIKAVHETLMGMTTQFINPRMPVMERPPLSKPAQTDLKIMIAEDNLLNQKLLLRVLEKLGHSGCILANDGGEAIDKYFDSKPDLILMDMEMPKVGGCEATQRIRLTAKSQPHIVALTANAFVEDREKCMAAGMCGYMSKPIEWSRLEEVLQEAIAISQGKGTCHVCQ